MGLIEFIDEFFKLILIFVLVGIGWQQFEIVMIGKINPNEIDTYISVILSLSLYKNFENQKWFNA